MPTITETANYVYRELSNPLDPMSLQHKAIKAEIRELFSVVQAATAKGLSVVGLVGDSWMWEDAVNGKSGMEIALQAALDARFGAGKWTTLNVSAGSRGWTTLPNNGPRFGEQINWLVNGGICSHVLIGTGFINDISNVAAGTEAAGEALIKADITAGLSVLTTAGIPFHIMNCPPFKGSIIYTAARLTLAQTINAWLSSTYAGKVWNIYSRLDDPADPGAILLSVAKADKFHITQAGKNAEASHFISTAAIVGRDESTNSLSITGNIVLDQSLTRKSNIKAQSLLLGPDNGNVGINSTRPYFDDPRPHGWSGQKYDAGSGWTDEVADDGNYKLQRYENSIRRLTFDLSGSFNGLTTLFSRLQVAGDGATTIFTGSDYGGGNGVAKEIGTDGSLGMRDSTFANGGGSFGRRINRASSHLFNSGDDVRVRVDSNGLHTGNFGGNPAAGRVYYGTAEQSFIGHDGSGYVFQGASYFAPFQDNATQFGAAGNRLTVIYAVSGTINTSDATEKTELKQIDDGYLLAALDTDQGMYQWLDAVEAKGDRARLHFGPTAQGFRDACKARGVDPNRLAAYCESAEAKPVSKTRVVTKQKTQQMTIRNLSEKIIDGQVHQFWEDIEREEILVQKALLFDADGNPVMKMVHPGNPYSPAIPAQIGKIGEIIRSAQPEILAVDPVFEQETRSIPIMVEVEEEYQVQEPTGRTLYGMRLDQYDRILSEARWRVHNGSLKWERLGK